MGDVFFQSIGGLLTFLTALVTLVVTIVRSKRIHSDVTEVKITTNGRLDELLAENRTLRNQLAAAGIEPETVFRNGEDNGRAGSI